MISCSASYREVIDGHSLLQRWLQMGLPRWLSGKESTYQAGSMGLEDLEKEMASHSSILGWEILWAEEHGGLLSMELQRSQTQLID